MSDATLPPRRMRCSYQSRCRAVQLMLGGENVASAAAACGASRATGYRWWVRYRAGGWRGLEDRPCTPPAIMTSAAPRRITSTASPIACVPAAQAVLTVFV